MHDCQCPFNLTSVLRPPPPARRNHENNTRGSSFAGQFAAGPIAVVGHSMGGGGCPVATPACLIGLAARLVVCPNSTVPCPGWPHRPGCPSPSLFGRLRHCDPLWPHLHAAHLLQA